MHSVHNIHGVHQHHVHHDAKHPLLQDSKHPLLLSPGALNCEDIDADNLAADFDGSFTGLGVDINTANYSMSEVGSTTGCTITENAPTRAFSWLKAPTSAFTFKTLLRHYAKRVLTPQSLHMKLGPRCNYHKKLC